MKPPELMHDEQPLTEPCSCILVKHVAIWSNRTLPAEDDIFDKPTQWLSQTTKGANGINCCFRGGIPARSSLADLTELHIATHG